MRAGSATRIWQLLECALGHSADGDYPAAESCLRKALSLPAPPDCHLGITRPALWNELGIVRKYRGKLDSAERYYRLALRHARRFTNTPGREFFLANLYHNLGGVEHARGRFWRAAAHARKGLRLRLQCVRSGSLAAASDMAALAAILDGLEAYKESEKLHRYALKIYQREYGSSHPEIAIVLNNLGALYQATKRPKRAEFFYRAALKMKRHVLPARHPDIAITMSNLAMFYSVHARHSLARLWSKRALQLLEGSLGHSHRTTRAVRKNHQRIARAKEIGWQ